MRSGPRARLVLTRGAGTHQIPSMASSGGLGNPGGGAMALANPDSPNASAAERDAAASARRTLDEVMDRFARGEDDAYGDVYRLGAPRIRAFLARLCADLALADDLTQESFIRILRARGAFAAGAPAIPWMLAIARNTFRDHARRERVRQTHHERAAEEPHRAASDPGGDRAAIARQMLEAAQQALADLPVRQREAFVLLRFEGLSLDEAAEVIGATPAAVKILVHRACVAIRATLERRDDERAGTSR